MLAYRPLCVFPAYTYLSLGCSKAAEHRMLGYARAQVGKPFSNSGMARSLVWPRTTDQRSFFCAGTARVLNPFVATRALIARVCAELVASILKVGGLMYASNVRTIPPICL